MKVLKIFNVATALALAACGGESTGPGASANLTGTYALTTIQGHTVPHTFTDPAGSQLTIYGDSLVMNGDGSYVLDYQGKLNAIEFDLGDEGLYDTSTGLKFYPSDGIAYTAQVNGSQIIFPRKIAGVQFSLGFTAQ